MSERSKQLRKKLEILGTRIGLRLIPSLPRGWVVALSRLMGRVAYGVSASLRNVGWANLNLAYGSALTPSQKREILIQSFRTFALTVLDMFWFAKDAHSRIARCVEFGPEFSRLFRKQRHICVTGHMGNWEILGQAITARGFPLWSVVAPLANPAVDEVFNQVRRTTQQKVLPRQGAVKGLLKALGNEEKIAVLLDQNTRPDEGGLFVNFFGLPVPVSGVGASLALRTDSEVFFGFCIAGADGVYRVHSPAHFTPSCGPGEDTRAAIPRVTQEIANVIETEIRKNPGAWLWMYKRWKYVAPGRRRSEYPFYAKEFGADKGS